MNMTDKGRAVMRWLYGIVVVAALAGWFIDKDPAELGPLIMWLTAAIGAGEASNIGKRATFKKEAVDAEAHTQ